MAIGEDQLAVILQASLDHAKELLEEAGGFLPFGTRALLNGDVEFLEAEGGQEPIDVLYRRIGEMLADDARRCDILAAALVANASLPAGAADDFETAVSVLVEAPDFCRSVVAPYRLAEGTVEFGPLIPEESDPFVFAIPAS